MKKIDKQSLDFAFRRGTQAFYPADEATMACCLRNDIMKETITKYVTVEVKGGVTQAQMVVDWRNLTGKPENVEIVEKMDQTLYETLIYKAFDP